MRYEVIVVVLCMHDGTEEREVEHIICVALSRGPLIQSRAYWSGTNTNTHQGEVGFHTSCTSVLHIHRIDSALAAKNAAENMPLVVISHNIYLPPEIVKTHKKLSSTRRATRTQPKWVTGCIPIFSIIISLTSRNQDIHHPATLSTKQIYEKQETCFDAREAERPSDAAEPLLDWRTRPPSIPDGVDCSLEHRNSLSPRWVLLD